MVYQDVASATNALRRLQGFNFYDKPLVSCWSRFAILYAYFFFCLCTSSMMLD